MYWLECLPVLVIGILIGPVVYRVDHWSRSKILAWTEAHWRSLLWFTLGVVAGTAATLTIPSMLSPPHEVVSEQHAQRHNAWEWGWDAWVAIGTVALAIATFWLSIATVRSEAQRRKEAEETLEKKNVAATNIVIFDLFRSHEQFANFKQQSLDGVRESRARHVELQPQLGIQWSPLRIDFGSLSFFLGSVDPNVLARLAKLEQRIGVAIDAVKQRDAIHLADVQVRTEELDRQRRGRVTLEEVELALGRKQTTILRTLTDAIYELTDLNLDDIPAMIEELRKLGKSMYPRGTFMGMMVRAPGGAAA